MKWNLQLIYVLLGTLLSLSACATDYPTTYSAEPIQAKVIDAETKQPLEGVIVTANWKLISGNAGGSTPVGQMMVLETTTDRDGVFRFPAWGPLKRKRGFLLIDDPQLLLFKSGYDYRRLNNYRDGVSLKGLWRAPVRTSQWDGKTIEMKKFTGTSKEWFEMLERSIPPIDNPEDAEKTSTLLKAILAEEDRISDSIAEKRPFFDNVVRRLLQRQK